MAIPGAAKAAIDDFEQALRGISESELDQGKRGWAKNINGVGRKLSNLSADKFSRDDSGSITAAIDQLQRIHEKVMNTNYYYAQDDETKAQLMSRIQENMNKLKQIKTQIETEGIEKDAEKYNANMQKAIMQRFKNKLNEYANQYNQNPLLLMSYPQDARCQPYEVYRITDNGAQKINSSYYPDGKNQYDSLSIAGLKASKMLKELQKRNWCKGVTVPKRPEDTISNQYHIKDSDE